MATPYEPLMKVGVVSVWGACLFGLAACGGGSSSDTGTGGLTGTWDLVASRSGGSQSTGTLVLSPNTLTVTIGNSTLTYDVSGASASLTWQERGSTSTMTVDRTNASFDTGVFPIGVGGSWAISQPSVPGKQCSGSIGTSTSVSCVDVNLPQPFPDPKDGEPYRGRRTATGSSIFGELGGEWLFTSSDSDQGCKARFTDSTVSIECEETSFRLDGTVNLTFSGDLRRVSGTTSSGYELAGTKR